MFKAKTWIAALLLCGLVLVSPAHAALVGIELGSANVNSDLNSELTNGWSYPRGGEVVSINGIDFKLASLANGDAGAVQAWNAESYKIPVNLSGVEKFYMLINSRYGSTGTNVGSVTFSFSNGQSYVYQLIEGTNVRDHFQNTFTNEAPLDAGTAYFPNGVRLDMLLANIPSDLIPQTLVSMTFTGAGMGYSGMPFLAGAVAQTVPLPAAFPLFGSGVVGLAGAAFKRRARKVA